MCCPLAIAVADGSNVGRIRRGPRARRSMRHDVVRRVRWGNVALACAVLAALAGVVVWPLVTSAPPGAAAGRVAPAGRGRAAAPARGRGREDERGAPSERRPRRARRRSARATTTTRSGAAGATRRRRADETQRPATAASGGATPRRRSATARARRSPRAVAARRRARGRAARRARPATAPSGEFGFERLASPARDAVSCLARMSAICSSIQSPGSRDVTISFSPRARRSRASGDIISAE